MTSPANGWLLDVEESIAAAMGPRYAVVVSWETQSVVAVWARRLYPAHGRRLGNVAFVPVERFSPQTREAVVASLAASLRGQIRLFAIRRLGTHHRRRHSRMAGK